MRRELLGKYEGSSESFNTFFGKIKMPFSSFSFTLRRPQASHLIPKKTFVKISIDYESPWSS